MSDGATRPCPVRFTRRLLDRLDRMAARLTERAAGARVSRTAVIRLACMRGLEALEREYQCQPSPPSSNC